MQNVRVYRKGVPHSNQQSANISLTGCLPRSFTFYLHILSAFICSRSSHLLKVSTPPFQQYQDIILNCSYFIINPIMLPHFGPLSTIMVQNAPRSLGTEVHDGTPPAESLTSMWEAPPDCISYASDDSVTVPSTWTSNTLCDPPGWSSY